MSVFMFYAGKFFMMSPFSMTFMCQSHRQYFATFLYDVLSYCLNNLSVFLFQEIPLSHIVNIEPAKIRPNTDPNKGPHVFEMRVNSTVYFIGEDPTFGGREGNIVASPESGVGLEQARYWEHAIRQALMPVTPTSSVVGGMYIYK